MNKQKQIEEMEKIIDELYNVYDTTAGEIAEGLYSAGYRKIPENAVVLTKEEYIDLSRNYVTEQIEQVRKKTVNKTIKYITHGQSRTRLYTIWCDMKQRCLNKNQQVFKYYGERKISICDEWKNNFNSFYDWAMKNGYADDLTIDRINVNGNYEPSNCRWATMQQQRRNTRKNVFVEINDVKKVLIDWCSDYKIKYTTVLSRIYKGWEIVTAITTPSRKYKEKLL